jgi:transposase
MSNGEWIGMLKTQTVKSTDFTIFLMMLCRITEEAQIDIARTATIHLDNARIHLSKETKKMVSHKNLKCTFLSPYSPECAAVELVFGVIKHKLRSKASISKINFSKECGMLQIVEALSEVRAKTIYR